MTGGAATEAMASPTTLVGAALLPVAGLAAMTAAGLTHQLDESSLAVAPVAIGDRSGPRRRRAAGPATSSAPPGGLAALRALLPGRRGAVHTAGASDLRARPGPRATECDLVGALLRRAGPDRLRVPRRRVPHPRLAYLGLGLPRWVCRRRVGWRDRPLPLHGPLSGRAGSTSHASLSRGRDARHQRDGGGDREPGRRDRQRATTVPSCAGCRAAARCCGSPGPPSFSRSSSGLLPRQCGHRVLGAGDPRWNLGPGPDHPGRDRDRDPAPSPVRHRAGPEPHAGLLLADRSRDRSLRLVVVGAPSSSRATPLGRPDRDRVGRGDRPAGARAVAAARRPLGVRRPPHPRAWRCAGCPRAWRAPPTPRPSWTR